jgi:hypothetical protein
MFLWQESFPLARVEVRDFYAGQPHYGVQPAALCRMVSSSPVACCFASSTREITSVESLQFSMDEAAFNSHFHDPNAAES